MFPPRCDQLQLEPSVPAKKKKVFVHRQWMFLFPLPKMPCPISTAETSGVDELTLGVHAWGKPGPQTCRPGRAGKQKGWPKILPCPAGWIQHILQATQPVPRAFCHRFLIRPPAPQHKPPAHDDTHCAA